MHSDDEILQVFEESEHPFLGTQEVADAVGFSTKQGAYKRLTALVDKGQLEHRVVGGSSIWWLPQTTTK